MTTKVVHKGRYLDLVVADVEINKTIRKFEIVIPPNAVAVLPIDVDGLVTLVKQFRPAVGKHLLELPAGIIDYKESIEDTATRELKEETGIVAKTVTFLGEFYHSEGYSSGRTSLMLATDLTYTDGQDLDTSEDIEIVHMWYSELYEKVMHGDIMDSKTIIAVLKYNTLYGDK